MGKHLNGLLQMTLQREAAFNTEFITGGLSLGISNLGYSWYNVDPGLPNLSHQKRKILNDFS